MESRAHANKKLRNNNFIQNIQNKINRETDIISNKTGINQWIILGKFYQIIYQPL